MIKAIGLMMAVGGLLVGGCATAPKSAAARASLDQQASQTVNQMIARDAGLRNLIDNSAGYVVFPNVKEGGFLVGAAAGKGVVFENGQVTGYAEVTKGSAGAEAGGQEYSELVIVKDPNTLQQMKSGKFDFGAEASAVVIHSGAADSTQFGDKGVAVFVQPRAGAMLNLSLTGQRIKFVM